MLNKNINQEQLSDVLGVRQSTVSRWLDRPVNAPTMRNIRAIADYFDVVEEDLITKDLVNVEAGAARLQNVDCSVFGKGPPDRAAMHEKLDEILDSNETMMIHSIDALLTTCVNEYQKNMGIEKRLIELEKTINKHRPPVGITERRKGWPRLVIGGKNESYSDNKNMHKHNNMPGFFGPGNSRGPG